MPRAGPGLETGRFRGRRPQLNDEQMQELALIVETGPAPATDGVVRWRRIDLCAVMERRVAGGAEYARSPATARLYPPVGGDCA